MMNNKLSDNFKLISSRDDFNSFLEKNSKTIEILEAMKPHLKEFFPKSEFSLELSDDLKWTTETKLLLNVNVTEDMFFNGMLDHFNYIYDEIDLLIQDIFCPIVLFPVISNENYDRFEWNCAINLIARTAYFNKDFDKNMQREMTLRDIPKHQQEKEIIEYCKKHSQPDLSDLVFDLQLDLFDVDDIIDELKEKGIDLNVKY